LVSNSESSLLGQPTDNVVLLVDDEPKIRRFLRAGFEMRDFKVLEADNTATALRTATTNSPDLIILDLSLPDGSGYDVLERIRAASNIPIIILSVVSSEDETVRLLQAGADDFVVKPFSMPELIARSEAALRRHFKVATRNPIVIAGPLKVDLVSRRVELNHIEVAMTKNEYHLLHILASHLGLVVPYDLLLKEIWPDNQRFTLQYLRVLIRQLREKIEADANQPRLVLNESGVGYRLVTPQEHSTEAHELSAGLP
jgi:two-component system, OmpR family, KDP operon response regulator KdpE